MSKAVVWRRGGTGSFKVTATLWSSTGRDAVDVDAADERFDAAAAAVAPSAASSMSGVEAQDCGRFFSSTLKWTTELSKSSVKCSEVRQMQAVSITVTVTVRRDHIHSHSMVGFHKWPLANQIAVNVDYISETAQHTRW